MEEPRPEAGTLIRNVGIPSGALTSLPKAKSPHCFLYPCSPACCDPGLTSGLSVVSTLSLLMGLQPPAPSQSKSSRPLPVPVSPRLCLCSMSPPWGGLPDHPAQQSLVSPLHSPPQQFSHRQLILKCICILLTLWTYRCVCLPTQTELPEAGNHLFHLLLFPST